jgi:hypothetical protein
MRLGGLKRESIRGYLAPGASQGDALAGPDSFFRPPALEQPATGILTSGLARVVQGTCAFSAGRSRPPVRDSLIAAGGTDRAHEFQKCSGNRVSELWLGAYQGGCLSS